MGDALVAFKLDETMTVSKVGKVDGKLQAAYYDKIVTTKAKNNTSYTLFNWSYDEPDGVYLISLNQKYRPIQVLESDSFKIFGKVIGKCSHI